MKRFWFGILTFACLCLSFAWAGTPTEFKGHTGYVASVAFSGDGSLFATASGDGTVKIWNFPAGKEMQVLKGHKDRVESVAVNKDGSIVATGGQDGSIRLWNPKDGNTTKEFPKAHAGGTLCVAFSPDGSLLASCGGDNNVKLWDVKNAKEVKTLGAHKGTAYSVVFNAAGTEIASCGNDGAIRVWDVKGQKEIKAMQVDLPKPVMKIEAKKEEPKDKKDVKKKDMARKDDAKEVRDAFVVVAFTPDGKQLLSGGHDKYLRFWNLADGKEAKKLGPTPDYTYGLAISKDGKYVATGGYGGSVRVYDLASGTRVYPAKQTDPKKDDDFVKAADDSRKGFLIYCLAFTPDGKSVIAGQHDLKGQRGVAKVITVLK